MDPEHIAYLAGFFDGEGCVMMHRKPIVRERDGETVFYYQLIITAAQTDPRPLTMLSDAFGGRTAMTGRAGVHGRNRNLYTWRASRTDVAELTLRTLLPHLVVKRAQAEIGLQFLGLYEGRRGSRRITSAELQQRAALYQQLRDLNRPWRQRAHAV